MTAHDGQYLTFELGDESYGVPLLKVKELIGESDITGLPESPDFVMGMMDLRGDYIPVLDLRSRMGLEPGKQTPTSVIIVAEIQSNDMLKCWEVKQCGKEDCPSYGSDDLRCWMTSGTHCRGEIQGSYHEKIEACKECEVYQDSEKGNHVFLVGLLVDSVSEVTSIDDFGELPPESLLMDADYLDGIGKVGDDIKLLMNLDRVVQNETLVPLAA